MKVNFSGEGGTGGGRREVWMDLGCWGGEEDMVWKMEFKDLRDLRYVYILIFTHKYGGQGR